MTTALHACTTEDAPILFDLMARYAAEHQMQVTDDERLAAVAPLLEEQPFGKAFLLGPRRAPVGYAIVTYSWSLSLGGIEACVKELYLREAIRGRGLSIEALQSLAKTLKTSGLKAMHIDVVPNDKGELSSLTKAGFDVSKSQERLTRSL